MNKIKLILSAAATIAAGASLAALPAPLATNAVQTISSDALGALNGGEASFGFFVRFDKLPSSSSPTRFFDLKANKDGTLSLTLPAAADDLVGDMVFTSHGKVQKGK